MAIEAARIRKQPKPWGVADPRPWSSGGQDGCSIGELWYERSTTDVPEPALLLKILLTSEPLSIQVHPSDAIARSMGLPHGKTEAWYVLDAQPGASVGLGLKQSLTPKQLRKAISDGTIANLVAWHAVSTGDSVFVPAGTIHAIGPGLVIAEIQQRSDATFRLFDHGRDRDLHVDQALAAAQPAPVGPQVPHQLLNNGRKLLASSSHFVFERLELEPGGRWHLDANSETWLLMLAGCARVGAIEVLRGEAIFAEDENIDFLISDRGAICLVAYTGQNGPIPQLLRRVEDQRSQMAARGTALTRPISMIGA